MMRKLRNIKFQLYTLNNIANITYGIGKMK